MRKRLVAGPLLISLLFYICYGLMFPTPQSFVDGLMWLLQNGHLFLIDYPIGIAFTAILTRKNVFDLIRQTTKEVAESNRKK